jgi:hypothetical protein
MYCDGVPQKNNPATTSGVSKRQILILAAGYRAIEPSQDLKQIP